MFKPGHEACQRAGVFTEAGAVGPDRHPKRFIRGQVTVGIDDDLTDLRAQFEQGVQRQWHAIEILQPFVHSAHARAAPSGKNHCGDGFGVQGVQIACVSQINLRCNSFRCA